MRAVVIGTDFIKDIDGSFKALETNTNIQMDMNINLFFNPEPFDSIISGSEINEIVLITKESLNSQNGDTELTPISDRWNNSISGTIFESQLREYCTGSNLLFTNIIVEDNAVTIPNIEDSNNKLIIRVSYDTTALIDDTYARDNWEFLKLMYDTNPNSIPNTYINDVELGFDSIGTTIRDNGVYPNYTIKKRITNINGIYPKIYKISTEAELSNLKSNLAEDEYLQEFIYNDSDVLNNKLKYYRSTDLIYGSNLSMVNLWMSEHTNWVGIEENCDFDDNNELQYWERPRYLPKPIDVSTKSPRLSGDETTKVFLPDGTNKLLSELVIGESIKAINIPGLDLNEIGYNINKWSGSFNDIMNGYSVETSSLQQIEQNTSWTGWFVEFTTEDNITFSDVSQAEILVKSGEINNYIVKFVTYEMINIGDVILLFDIETNSLVEKTIQSTYYTFGKADTYVADFEQIDVFLSLEESANQRYGIITHNYSYDCRAWTTQWGGGYDIYCYRCLKGSWGAAPATACCRYGWWYGIGAPPTSCPCDSLDAGYYCNWQKSDIHFKENVALIGKSIKGINIYQYNYKNEPELYEGVIAQELIGTDFENALAIDKNGMYLVNYRKLDVEFKQIN